MSKTVFITGGDSGIGLACAQRLAKEGYDIYLAARNEARLQKAAEDIHDQYHVDTGYYLLDVSQPEEIHHAAGKFLEDRGAPDILLNDAGLARGLEPYDQTKESDILEMIHTNIQGLFLVTHAFLPAMVKRNTGHIINMGSTAGLYAYAGAAVYCASKAAVKTFSDGLRIDLMKTDIKVTTIQPGLVETNFSTVRFHNDTERAAKVYEGIEALQASDIAEAVAFAAVQPRRVQISDIVIMANQQGTGFLTYHTPEKK